MLKAIVGLIVGIVVGVTVGATMIAPRLNPEQPSPAGVELASVVAGPADPAKPSGTAPLESARSGLPSVRWRMASAFPATLPQLGTLAKRVEAEVWRVTGGKLELKFHEPGALVAPDKVLDALAEGKIEALFASPAVWGEAVPAMRLFASVPFGPPPSEHLAWFYFGGGRGLMEAHYHKLNVHGLHCGVIAPEASGWYREPVTGPADLEGRKIAMAGLGAKVLARLGALPEDRAAGDLFVGLENGDLDGAEFSMPAVDLELGFHELVKNYYFPGWHQPSTLFDLMINLDRWKALSATQRAQVESVCGDNVRHGLAEGEALQFAALKALLGKGVEIRRWPPDVIDALKAAWQDVAAEEAAANADFREVWESLATFREDYAVWRDLGHP